MDNSDSMTDQEIYAAAHQEWMSILATLWELIGKPIDPKRLRIYGKNLESVPLGLLELAINRVFRENSYQTVPVPGVIWDAIKKELGNPYNLDMAVENWAPPARPKKIIEFMEEA
jgi:hypothetical protein